MSDNGPDYSAHDFRHTVASSLEHNGAREAAIYAILGWSPDGSIRLRHYTAMPMHVLSGGLSPGRIRSDLA